MQNKQEDLVGKVIDGYKILELKGQGRYCRVYKAKDEDFENSFVAVKTVSNAEEPVLEREAKILDKLQGNEHIPKIFRFERGEAENPPRLYMEYFESSLKDILNKKGKLQWREATEIAIQVLKGLEHASSKCLWHKDIKPSNILTDGKKYVLTDFNLADSLVEAAQKEKDCRVELSGGLDVSVGKARLSCIGGTEGYKAPEQITGSSKDVDGRTDVYSLSVVLYEMITGELPLGSFQIPNNVPNWLSETIRKGLSKNKNHRFGNASLMRNRLEEGLEGRLDEIDFGAAFAWIDGKIKAAQGLAVKAAATAGHGLWTAVKYTVGAPITLACYNFRKSNEAYHFQDEKKYHFFGAMSTVLAIILYASAAIIPPVALHYHNVAKELRNSDRRGKIAYVIRDEIKYYDASRMLEEDRQETRLCPQGIKDIVGNIVWSADGKKIYFIAKDGTTRKELLDPKEPAVDIQVVHLYSIDLDGNQQRIMEIGGEYSLHKTLFDGEEVIMLRRGSDQYHTLKLSKQKIEQVVKVTPEIEESQQLSPDKKYQLKHELKNRTPVIKVTKNGKAVRTLLEGGEYPAWWHGGEQK